MYAAVSRRPNIFHTMPYPHHLHRSHRPVGCGTAAAPGMQLVEIILLKSEITHDIQAEITTIERMRKMQDTPILSNDDTDSYTISRQIDSAVNSAVSRCQAYLLLPSPSVHRISTNHIMGWEEKSMYLALPMNWPSHNIDALRDAVHNYIVKAVVFYLLSIAIPGDPYLPVCLEQRDTSYNEINRYLSSRLGGVKIHPTFLG